jgi:peptide/nickel transport system substrate-binding protein
VGRAKATRDPEGGVDLYLPSASMVWNYAEGLVTLDRDNNVVPCLAIDWRWVNDRTIEFKLRKGVVFHNGEDFNADVPLIGLYLNIVEAFARCII